MITKKTYIEVAKILNKFSDRLDSHDFNDLVFEFSELFFADNSKFNEDKFNEACYVTEQIPNLSNSIRNVGSNYLWNSFRNKIETI